MAFTALFDACVLYPASLRDTLLNLAQTGLFRARWSAEIHSEWITAVLRCRPELGEQLQRTQKLMDAAVEDAVVTGHQAIVDSLKLPDQNDRHVLAAAIIGRADVIVTYNIKHFPVSILANFKIKPQHPDIFIRHLLDLSEVAALSAFRMQRASLTKPPYNQIDFLDKLAQQQLTETVAFLRSRTDQI